MHFQKKVTLFFSLILMCGYVHAESDTWNFTIEPYLMASSIKGNAGVGRIAGVPVDVDFSTILENLSMGAMVHFEAQNKAGWGIVLDYGFMDLNADTTVGFGGVVDAGLRQGIFEGFVSRQFGRPESGLEAFAGIRWWDNQIRASFDPVIHPGSTSTRIDEDWIDPIVGLRWTNELSSRWDLRLRGDMGGFGISSDFTWSASASALFRMNDRFVLELAYKALDVDYDNGKASDQGFFAYDTTTHGPLVGLVIEF
jgi:hypothetical protein